MTTIPTAIPIKIQPLFWLLAFFIAWISATGLAQIILAVLIILFSVIVHEFGHALTATFFGQKTRIELAAFGGFTYREGKKLKLWQEFLVVLNGPLAGLCLFGVSFLLLNQLKVVQPHLVFALYFATKVNLIWTILNLIPVMPLDGGHLLSIILEAIFGFKGIKMAVIAGLVVSIAISILFFAIGDFLVGALFLLLTFESFRALRYYKLFNEKDRDSAIQALLRSAEMDLAQGQKDKAYAKFEDVKNRTGEGILYTLATEEMARIRKDQGRFSDAYTLLLAIEKSISQENLPLLHYLAFMNRDFDKVKALSKDCYQVAPRAETALFNALAFAELNDVDAAMGWLECAIREGLSSLDKVIEREEFNKIRNNERFIELTRSYIVD